jgi:hypothetical protein
MPALVILYAGDALLTGEHWNLNTRGDNEDLRRVPRETNWANAMYLVITLRAVTAGQIFRPLQHNFGNIIGRAINSGLYFRSNLERFEEDKCTKCHSVELGIIIWSI